MSKILGNANSLLYVYRSKNTGEYIDEDGNPTNDILEATGYHNYNDAVKNLEFFDEPEEWYIVEKITSIVIVGDPVEITTYI